MAAKQYKRYSRKGQIAVNFLFRKKEGEVPDAIFNRNVGWIDIVWGYTGTAKSDGYGLSKIVKYHPEVISKLDSIIKTMKVKRETTNRVNLENKNYLAVIRKEWDGKHKIWLLTAFKKKS